MKKDELKAYVGKYVRVTFYDKTEAEGLLCFSENFTQTHVRVGYFYIPEHLKGIICFKVSHVRKVVEL